MKKELMITPIGELIDYITAEDAEMLDPPYSVDEGKKQLYTEAISLLSTLASEGKITLEANDPDKPYFLHAVFIKWRDEKEEIEIEAKRVSEMLSKFDTLIIDGNEWMISTRIYKRQST